MNFIDFWQNLGQVGIDANSRWQQNRHIILCNRIAIFLSLLTFLVCLIATSFFGFSRTVLLGFTSSLLFLVPILLNHLQFPNGSRVFLASSLSVAAIAISILDKHDFILMEEFQYFHLRLMLLIAGLFPFVLFTLDELPYWIPTALINAICIFFYDPIHEFFGVGYYQVGFHGPNYYFLNYMTIAAALVIGGSTYFLKKSFEETEKKNEGLIKNLNEANQLIHQQQKIVSEENLHLSRNLKEKNTQLLESNEELIRHNNELQQFSYTVSHNLRGPVASLGGLINIFNHQNQSKENQELLAHIDKSLLTLESTIQDLSQIIDIRNNLSQIRQKIILHDELIQIRSLLGRELSDHHVEIETDFSAASEIYAVKHMVDSILYNLISNAIKYRSPDRKPHIKIFTRKNDSQLILSVADNGLGLDVEKNREKLFGLYKRFHTHMDGRGLGLFLVKLQTQSMGGTIDIVSKIGSGSTFIVTLPIPPTLNEQILFENTCARLYYEASLNAVGIHWKEKVTLDEFKEFLWKAVNFIKTFQTPNWISNVSDAADRDESALNLLRIRVRADLKEAGLKRIAIIMPKANFPDHEQRKAIMKTVYDAETEFFDTLEEAKEWLMVKNKNG